jgi:hypothetical protein
MKNKTKFWLSQVAHRTRNRDVAASEAVTGRLHEAMDQPVLTVPRAIAFEGRKGHGVFAWRQLDALKNAP